MQAVLHGLKKLYEHFSARICSLTNFPKLLSSNVFNSSLLNRSSFNILSSSFLNLYSNFSDRRHHFIALDFRSQIFPASSIIFSVIPVFSVSLLTSAMASRLIFLSFSLNCRVLPSNLFNLCLRSW